MITAMRFSRLVSTLPASLSARFIHGDAEFIRVSTDTRQIKSGDLFVALKGEHFDGHDHVVTALHKGACGLLVEREIPHCELPQLIVDDTLLALGEIASLNRKQFTKPLVAITGSSGKTTVRTMVSSVLSEMGQVHATKGNLNNHIGMPLTLLELSADDDFAVIEMGASAKGEIAYLCQLATPTIAYINNIMPAHLEGFGSIDGVAEAKSEIYQALADTGTAVINLDEPYACRWLEQYRRQQIVTFSSQQKVADLQAKNIQLGATTATFDLCQKEQRQTITLNVTGHHNISNAMAAAAIGYTLGASFKTIALGLQKFNAVAGRSERFTGVAHSQVIDDTYNANPGSVRAAIDVLALQAGEKILVLGDLAELGPDAEKIHAELGAYAHECMLDAVYSLGQFSAAASQMFGHPEYHFTDKNELIAALSARATNTTTFLIKGSRSSRMEIIVRGLVEPETSSLGENH